MSHTLRLTRRLIAGLAVALVCLPLHLIAQSFPDKPIRLIVPFPPGGASDIFARVIGEKLVSAIGQPIVVENRPGAGGLIAAELVAKSGADGYTLLLGSSSTHGTNSVVFKKLPYDPVRDFAPISMLARLNFALHASAMFPARTAGELVALAKEQPGKINYASYGIGSSTHLMMELLISMTGINLVHVPFKGSTAAQMGMVANDVQVMFDGIANASAHVKSGKLKIIAVGSGKRSPTVPEVPTVSESGVPGFDVSSYYAIFAPAGTPRNVVTTLNREFVRAIRLPDIRKWLTTQAYEEVGSTPEELAEAVTREIAKWKQLVQERNLKFD